MEQQARLLEEENTDVDPHVLLFHDRLFDVLGVDGLYLLTGDAELMPPPFDRPSVDTHPTSGFRRTILGIERHRSCFHELWRLSEALYEFCSKLAIFRDSHRNQCATDDSHCAVASGSRNCHAGGAPPGQ